MKTDIDIPCPECSAVTVLETPDIFGGEIKIHEYKCVGCSIKLRIELECVLEPRIRRNSDPEVVG